MGEFDTAAAIQPDSPFAPAQTPRLSILHLMLWTLCSAVQLALTRAINALRGEMPGQYAAIQDASSVMQGIIAGAVFMGAIVLVSTRVRGGRPMLRQPGHWLLLVPAIFYLLFLPINIAQVLIQKSGFGGTSFFVFFGMIYLLPAIGYIFAARHNRVLRWKVIFVALAILLLAQALFFAGLGLTAAMLSFWIRILSSVTSSGRLLLAAAVVAVALSDLAAGRRYDWLHWTGVAAFVTGSSVTLLWMIGSWFIR